VDKVELLLPSPFFCYVVDVEYAVGWDPEGWGWVEINSIDGKLVRFVNIMALLKGKRWN